MTHHLFLSPHLDDVPLSCGGTLAMLSDNPDNKLNDTIAVITIFAGELPATASVSAFAAHQHDMWGHPNQAYQVRRAEDEAALAHFNLSPIWLDFLDCIYRGDAPQQVWYYNSDDDIFGLVHAAEFEVVSLIAAQIGEYLPKGQSPSEIAIYAPLTVGRHVDHQLAFLVALSLLEQGHPVFFYEEFPYADRDPAHLTVALNETTPMLLKQATAFAQNQKLKQGSFSTLWAPTLRPFSTAALQHKIAAIAAYQTQLEVLFGGEASMVERVTAYAKQVGQDMYAERYWQLNL